MKFLLAVLFCGLTLSIAVPAQRRVAITIDDLPVVSTRTDIRTRREITKKLLGHIKKAKIPAIGFVNENKLYKKDERDPEQIALLKMWLDAGLELGNHTYSHRSLHSMTLAEYEADLLRGEIITKELLKERGRSIRFFRHPFLQTGRTDEIKTEFDKFLKDHGYRIAPISFDNADYIFSRAYDIAYDKHDKKLMKKVGDAYIPYMRAKLVYWEKQSTKLFGREIAQTLLIHANFINSDYLDDLAKMFKERGYEFVDLETALKDEAFAKPDRYYGRAGISWLHRWALEEGREKLEKDEPLVPDFVLKLSGFESE